jgi:hypothetical protein
MSAVVIPEYNSSRVYRYGELVSYSGLYYVSLSVHRGNLPTDTNYWGTLAESVSVPDASTSVKGKASFGASDFNVTAGAVTVDYTNGQGASGSTKGFLTSSDWTTFNSKQPAITPGTFVPDPTGGGVIDAESRTAIAAIIDLLVSKGIMAAS